jgi:AcrR family transcriptional regulator
MAATSQPSLRSDAERNRKAILAAARQSFAESGDVPMYEIARRAGVGQGTLYRHFPDRSVIATAIFGEELDQVEALAAQHSDDPDAFFLLIRSVVQLQARLHGLIDCLDDGGAPASDPHKESDHAVLKDRLVEIIEGPFREAQASGSLRADVEIDDVLLVLAMVEASLRKQMDAGEHAKAADRALTIALEGLVGPGYQR